jgi:ATP-dependent helicase Lhr and Lhr-like helicase
VIAALHPGKKRLVFVDSRRKVEALGQALREQGVDTYVTHSSLSVDERKAAERAFEEARDCVIVATSALELGIDIGDLDHVLQIDAPSTVAAFLQRMGRAGRRSGTVPNCTFLATDDLASCARRRSCACSTTASSSRCACRPGPRTCSRTSSWR